MEHIQYDVLNFALYYLLSNNEIVGKLVGMNNEGIMNNQKCKTTDILERFVDFNGVETSENDSMRPVQKAEQMNGVLTREIHLVVIYYYYVTKLV